MKVYTETSLEDFEAWSGGEDHLKVLRDKGVCDEVEQYINEIFPDGLEEITLNDYLWFDVEDDFPQYFKEDEEESDD